MTEERGLSVRWRLTIVYTAVAVASAAVLVAGIYVLVSLDQRPSAVMSTVEPLEGELVPGPGAGDVTVRRALIKAQDEAVDDTLHNLLVWSGLGLALMTVVSVAVGWVFAGRALRPVHTITSRAQRISADALDERLRLEGPPDELKEMADTFDALLDRLQETVDSERRLVATMSHELRTPLANQRAALDVALADPDADPATLRRAGEVALGRWSAPSARSTRCSPSPVCRPGRPSPGWSRWRSPGWWATRWRGCATPSRRPGCGGISGSTR